MKVERDSTKEGPRYINFAGIFHDLSKELTKAYSVSDDIYFQKSPIKRSNEDPIPDWGVGETGQSPTGYFKINSSKGKNNNPVLIYATLLFPLNTQLFDPNGKMTYNYYHGN
ncbi:hypothetical protein A2394_02700 [Candidatus Woesebacteria bacterium RIFOXYB1_FULL_42_36]|uniref:Uncharacterized protein n=2 Tax=Candidatus Woeseibacteriota TaxID=1752722 RepID=A0A1F8DHW7_9BACT|nr:MAG: hypothetical protein UW20_C0012G0002 [Candidatus Woesebacteria bacterium GW2011_GWB1_44_11]OGM76676.1 MAG: hypothetical protein A2208_03145 [Candidatus Woesebacteria bacterium RIFOXYA1_FULL_43_16]OGM83171.1 MAG: hypothetical protein A2394_02700 [Candidatus Woesebacteria bacterium RIFOXYB1_FULL_42_36]OGM84854.1 MAG: hypothetical protein A2421_01525 [Candidatus Woesebacteria bacterium RIFOXYC1_FULL_43_18]OGM88193.1 MAG: hypothetical protein A2573_02160 [Candidatus Woesebacteria bacterium 